MTGSQSIRVGLVLMVVGGCVAEGLEPNVGIEAAHEEMARVMETEVSFGECPWEDYELGVVPCGDYSLTGSEPSAMGPVCKPDYWEGWRCAGHVNHCDCIHSPERHSCDDDSQVDGILPPEGSGSPVCETYQTRYAPDPRYQLIGYGATMEEAEADYWAKANQQCDLGCVTGEGGSITEVEGEEPQDAIVCCVPDDHDPDAPWPPPPGPGSPDPVEPIPDSPMP